MSFADDWDRAVQDKPETAAYPIYTGKRGAQGTMAAVHRRDWDNYKQRFVPELDRLINYATSDQPIEDTVQRVGTSVDRGYETSQQAYGRDLSRYGMSERADERGDRMRLAAMDQSASRNEAQNQSRLHVQDLQNRILSGDMATGLREMNTQGT